MTLPPQSEMPPWVRRAVVTGVAVVLGTVALLWLLSRLRGLIFMVFLALFVSVALEPAVQYLAKRGWRRGLATGLVFLAAFLLTVGLLASLIPLFVQQATSFAAALPGYLDEAEDLLRRYFNISLIDQDIREQIQDLGALLRQYGSRLAGGLFGVGSAVFGFLFRAVTVALFAFYMVAEGPKLRRTVLSFLPPDRQREALRVWEIAVEKTGGYVYSRFILAVVSAVFTAIVLSILGVPFAVALGVWVGVLSQFVPVVGTYIAGVVPVLVTLFQSPLKALWVLVALLAYQQLENFVIAPRITARTMAMHPAVSIGAVIAGASLLGAIGAVLALPMAATIQAFISTVVARHELIEAESLTG